MLFLYELKSVLVPLIASCHFRDSLLCDHLHSTYPDIISFRATASLHPITTTIRLVYSDILCIGLKVCKKVTLEHFHT